MVDVDHYMMIFTATVYWALVVCWLFIVIFYGRQYHRFKRIYPLVTTLLIVLFIDGTRTLIESAYFGARYTARTELIPYALYTLLDQPQFVAIPKVINLVAAMVIIVVIVRRWFDSLAEEQRRRARTEQFRSELISLASHELRAPLTTIQGYARTLVGEFGQLPEATQKEFLEGIASESDRLSHLISALMDMNQIEEGRLRIEPRTVTPKQLCEEAVRSATHPQLNHVLRVQVSPGLPEVLADPQRIHQALSNLISNAIKFSPEGSESIVGARPKDGTVEFFVADHGVGIPREEQAKVFTPFHRATNAHGSETPGSGLGLYIAKGIVEAHGGSIGFHSAVGTGTTFFFTLPPAAGEPQAEQVAREQPDTTR